MNRQCFLEKNPLLCVNIVLTSPCVEACVAALERETRHSASTQTIWPGNQLDAVVVLPIIGGKQGRTMARQMDSLYQNVV